MMKKHNSETVHYRQARKFAYVIRNTGTGAYLCDIKLHRRIFPTYKDAERELARLRLSPASYETEVLM